MALSAVLVIRRSGAQHLVAIVGEPASLGEALSASDGAFLFAVLAALVSGAVTLGLKPATEAVKTLESDPLTHPHPEVSAG